MCLFFFAYYSSDPSAPAATSRSLLALIISGAVAGAGAGAGAVLQIWLDVYGSNLSLTITALSAVCSSLGMM